MGDFETLDAERGNEELKDLDLELCFKNCWFVKSRIQTENLYNSYLDKLLGGGIGATRDDDNTKILKGLGFDGL